MVRPLCDLRFPAEYRADASFASRFQRQPRASCSGAVAIGGIDLTSARRAQMRSCVRNNPRRCIAQSGAPDPCPSVGKRLPRRHPAAMAETSQDSCAAWATRSFSLGLSSIRKSFRCESLRRLSVARKTKQHKCPVRLTLAHSQLYGRRPKRVSRDNVAARGCSG